MKSTGCFLLTILALFASLICLVYVFIGGIGTSYYVIDLEFNTRNAFNTTLKYIHFTPQSYCIDTTTELYCSTNFDQVDKLDIQSLFANRIDQVDKDLVNNKLKASENIQKIIQEYTESIITLWNEYILYVKIGFYILFASMAITILVTLGAFKTTACLSYACILIGFVFLVVTGLAIILSISVTKITNYILNNGLSPYIILHYTNSIYVLGFLLGFLLCSFIVLVIVRKEELARIEIRESRNQFLDQITQQQTNMTLYTKDTVIELEKNQDFTLDDSDSVSTITPLASVVSIASKPNTI